MTSIIHTAPKAPTIKITKSGAIYTAEIYGVDELQGIRGISLEDYANGVPVSPLKVAAVEGVMSYMATPVTPTTYLGGDFDGSFISGGALTEPRKITFKTTASVGTYNIYDPIVVSGPGSLEEELRLTDQNGGQLISGDTVFYDVISVYVPAQNDANGDFALGVAAVLSPEDIYPIVVNKSTGAEDALAVAAELFRSLVWQSASDSGSPLSPVQLVALETNLARAVRGALAEFEEALG